MAIVFNDTFTDTNGVWLENHTPDVGTSWTVSSTLVVSISGNQAITNTDNPPPFFTPNPAPTTAEYKISFDMKSGSITQEISHGRRINIQNYYYIKLTSSSGLVELYKKVSGSSTSLGSYTIAGFSTTTFYNYILELLDATKKVYIDTVERISSTDNSLTSAGNAAAIIASTAGAIDNFQLNTIVAVSALDFMALREMTVIGANAGTYHVLWDQPLQTSVIAQGLIGEWATDLATSTGPFHEQVAVSSPITKTLNVSSPITKTINVTSNIK